MTVGERLLDLRKKKGLSQEEVANILNVSRQTVSKWETGESRPDFDKIVPICELFEISSEELLTGNSVKSKDIEINSEDEEFKRKKRTEGLVRGIFLYFVAVAWITASVAGFNFNPVISAAIFLLICGVATCILIYPMIIYRKEKTEEEKRENKIIKQIDNILSIITLIIYLIISFATMAWHITWIIWIIYSLIIEIVKLIVYLRGENNEK